VADPRDLRSARGSEAPELVTGGGLEVVWVDQRSRCPEQRALSELGELQVHTP
jgi:hypothetical protein